MAVPRHIQRQTSDFERWPLVCHVPSPVIGVSPSDHYAAEEERWGCHIRHLRKIVVGSGMHPSTSITLRSSVLETKTRGVLDYLCHLLKSSTNDRAVCGARDPEATGGGASVSIWGETRRREVITDMSRLYETATAQKFVTLRKPPMKTTTNTVRCTELRPPD